MATLDRGILGRAILDVTTPEPLRPDSKLWHTQNLAITPHVSSDDDANYTDLALDLLYRTWVGISRVVRSLIWLMRERTNDGSEETVTAAVLR